MQDVTLVSEDDSVPDVTLVFGDKCTECHYTAQLGPATEMSTSEGKDWV